MGIEALVVDGVLVVVIDAIVLVWNLMEEGAAVAEEAVRVVASGDRELVFEVPVETEDVMMADVVAVVKAELGVVAAEEIQKAEAQRAYNSVGQSLRVEMFGSIQDILVAAFLLVLAETLVHLVVVV